MPVTARSVGNRGPGSAVRRRPRDLLRAERQAGYPAEYLRSRIRGRRSKLIRNWREVQQEQSPALYLSSPRYEGFVHERSLERLWAAVQEEHAWVFAQMDEELRCAVAPYLLYVELRTVIMCLRFRAAERDQQAGEVLQASLLCREAKDLLRSTPLPGIYREVEDLLCSFSPAFRGVAARYEAGEARRAEHHLVDAFVQAVLALPLHPVLRGLFERLIDARNLLSLYKAGRYGAQGSEPFLAGGTVAPDRLAAALATDDPYAVLRLLKQSTGVVLQDPDLTKLETALYRWITRFLRGEGRDPLGLAVVLDYLWRCSLEVTNLGILFAARNLGREEASAELVY